MINGTVSKHVNNNAQVYGTSFGLLCLFPMKLKSGNHETLPLLFKHDGVLPEITMDNSKEHFSGDFCKKLRDDNCHQKTIEPHSHWITASEMNTRELKCGISRNMIKTHSPKILWGHFAELESRN